MNMILFSQSPIQDIFVTSITFENFVSEEPQTVMAANSGNLQSSNVGKITNLLPKSQEMMDKIWYVVLHSHKIFSKKPL